MKYTALDLFAGCGGLSTGLRRAGFEIVAAIEFDEWAAKTYKLNHASTKVIVKDIREVDPSAIRELLAGRELDLLAGCPPCQGFSSIRRLNKGRSVRDPRNKLILEYLRFVKALTPRAILLENVAWLQSYYLFDHLVAELTEIGYCLDYEVVNAKHYGVPQNRKRLVLVGSREGEITIAPPIDSRRTVRDAIGALPSTSNSSDPIHKIFPRHSDGIMELISLVPKDGGSRKDLPEQYTLECHKATGVGFNDIYGRLSWNSVSGTITGGCLNPSKGRFLHPSENRCITAREAALLQSFPAKFKFPDGITKDRIALLIGNAFPPRLSYYQGKAIKKLLSNRILGISGTAK